MGEKEYTDEIDKGFAEMVEMLDVDNVGIDSFNYNNQDGQVVVLIPKYPSNPKEYAALAHELLHATFHVLNFCRVEYSYNGSNECFTYLLEHLTMCALERNGYENV